MKIYFPLRFAVTGFTLIAITGCSTFSGTKLGDDAGSKVIGVPYTMVRPEYTLTRTPPPEGQKKATYVVGVTYEPDPKQRYTLSINPGIFADPNFLMKFGAGGVLQGTTATVAETLTPTITAIGSFGANLIGTMATGVFDKDSVRNIIITAMSNSSACRIKPPDIDLLDTGDTLPDTVGDAMKERIKAFKDDAEFAELFHYATDKEKECLTEANSSIETLITSKHKDILDGWKKDIEEYQRKFPQDKLFIARLKDAVSTDDKKQLEVIKKEIANDGKSNNGSSDFRKEEFSVAHTTKALCDKLRVDKFSLAGDTIGTLNELLKQADINSKIKQKRPDVTPSEYLKTLEDLYAKEGKEDNLKRLNRVTLEEYYPQETPKSLKPTADERDKIYSLAAGAAEASMSNEAQEKLTFFVEMDAPTWRARHLQYLEREIDRSTLIALRRPTLDRTKVKQFVDRMRMQRAVTIDAVVLFTRALELERFLQRVPNKSVDGGGTAPAATEYATVRAELDAILTQMDARRTRVIADAKPAPPPSVTPLKVANLPVATKELIEESKAPSWIKGPGADAPNYVMILTGVE